MENCGNCRFFKKYDLEDGTCRRYPPVVHNFNDADNPDFNFPIVDTTDWCGEWSEIARFDPILIEPVATLNLSVRVRKCLHREGIETVGQLLEKHPDDLFDIRNFGASCLVEIRLRLRERNLKFKSDPKS